jgi:hypothetical protein
MRNRSGWTLVLPLVGVLIAAAFAPAQTKPDTAPTQAASAPATEPVVGATTSPTTRPVGADLIDALSSPDPRARRHAAEDLLKLGESARPLLEDLLKETKDLDVITRAQATLAQLAENRMIGPSYITLHFKNAPAREVAQELGRQAFAPLRPFPENLWDDPGIPKVTIDVERQPFWKAMRQFTEQTGLDLQPYVDGMRLMRGMGRSSGVAVVQGPFLIVAQQISRMQVVQLGPHGGQHSEFSMQMVAYPEPKIVAVQGGTTMEIKEAVDDAGNSLVGGTADRRMFSMGNSGAWQLYARLNWPPHPGKRIVRLVCATTFTLQTKSQKLEIPDVLNAKEQTHTLGGTEVTFHGLTKAEDNWELKISAGNGVPFQQLMQNRLQLLDADGNALERRGMSGQGNGEQMIFKLLFGASRRADGKLAGSPDRLIWEVPLESKSVPVQFEFDDLPMPN